LAKNSRNIPDREHYCETTKSLRPANSMALGAFIGGSLPTLLSVKNEVCFTFVQALRDVVADFQNNRTNPLLTLLKSKSGEINPDDFKAITKMVADLNSGIETLPDVEEIRQGIRSTITGAAGETYPENFWVFSGYSWGLKKASGYERLWSRRGRQNGSNRRKMPWRQAQQNPH
jgi:hypothetical protein